MITKDQLQQMSDFEVNKTLAQLVGWEVAEICDKSPRGMTSNFHKNYPNTLWVRKGKNQPWEEQVCFTQFPDDIMPLAFEHKISLLGLADGSWQAMKNNMIGVSVYFYDENPLRAIACCVILVLQEKSK